jgi:hypothetical protein
LFPIMLLFIVGFFVFIDIGAVAVIIGTLAIMVGLIALGIIPLGWSAGICFIIIGGLLIAKLKWQ